MFTSNRNAFKPPKRLPHTLQLFVMDDDGANVECIGHLNLGMALHPVVLTDGRVMFSSLESQGLRSSTLWGLWSIHPDGTNWGPLVSAFMPGAEPERVPLPDAALRRLDRRRGVLQPDQQRLRQLREVPARPCRPASRRSAPATRDDPRNPPLRHGRLDDGKPRVRRLPFSPFGIESLTPFARTDEGPADFADRVGQPLAAAHARVGKFTHPVGGAGQSPAHRLVARPGQRRLHGPSARGRRRHLPDQGRQGRSTSRARCC